MEGSSDMADGEAVVRPLSTPLHVTDHCKNRVTSPLVHEFVQLNITAIVIADCKIFAGNTHVASQGKEKSSIVMFQ